MKISTTIITLNEETHLARCLESVRGVADEIIVVDSGSQDRTREIAESHGVKFLTRIRKTLLLVKPFMSGY
jgi:glycosyltransferase involved in cell wall biosynthesis